MRFPFFSLRRNGETGICKRKLGGICCFHARAPSMQGLLFGPTDVTAIVHDSASEERNQSSQRGSSGREDSPTTSYSETNDPTIRSSIVHTARSATDTEESTSISRAHDVTPMGGFQRVRSLGKGPGLGAVDDEPPSRMTQECQELDLSSLFQPRRRDSNGTMAPQLPTRLEVCVDRHRPQPYQPILADSAVSMTSDRSIGSHPLSESSPSSLADSVAPRRRPSSDAPHRSESSSRTSGRSSSPSAVNGTATRREEIASQPTRLATQDVWRFGSNANEGGTSMRDAQRLSAWHVRLKLDWVSDASNDLVAEVCLDSRLSPASVNSSSSERARQMVCEITEEDEDNEARIESPLHDIMMSNHTSVVDIVDHVLAELQRVKRSKRANHGSESTLRSSLNERRHKTSTERDNLFETEFYRERCSSASNIRRRLEILQSFEVLIDKKQHRIHASNGSDGLTESYSEKMLADAVFHDLKLEIAQLAAELQNRRSCSDDGWGPQLSSQALRSSTSRFQTETIEDEASSADASSRGKRTQSAPVASTCHTLGFSDTLSMQRSSSCYSELQPVTISRLNNGTSLMAEVKDKCSRMASLDEESLFAKVSDLASSTAS